MSRIPEFSWNEETGMAVCVLKDTYGNKFIGSALCDEEDQDMKSEKTGCQIALYRAEIKYYIHLRDNEIKPAIKTLKAVYYTMNKSKKFNPKSYENIMLWRQIHLKESDLDIVNKTLAQKRNNLKEYLEQKQNFYNHIRQNRNNTK